MSQRNRRKIPRAGLPLQYCVGGADGDYRGDDVHDVLDDHSPDCDLQQQHIGADDDLPWHHGNNYYPWHTRDYYCSNSHNYGCSWFLIADSPLEQAEGLYTVAADLQAVHCCFDYQIARWYFDCLVEQYFLDYRDVAVDSQVGQYYLDYHDAVVVLDAVVVTDAVAAGAAPALLALVVVSVDTDAAANFEMKDLDFESECIFDSGGVSEEELRNQPFNNYN